MRTLVILNCAIERLGVYESFLAEHHMPHDIVAAHEATLPSPASYDAFLIGGTPDPVYEREQIPYLASVHSFLTTAVQKGIPCFGICAGAQLLASVLGAVVRPNPTKEIGVSQVVLTEAGAGDPVLAGFPPSFPVFQWHGDTFEIPFGGHLLAQGAACTNQMFRHGNVIGVQFHLEVGRDDATAWANQYRAELATMGKTAEELANEFEGQEEILTRLGHQLVENFFASV